MGNLAKDRALWNRSLSLVETLLPTFTIPSVFRNSNHDTALWATFNQSPGIERSVSLNPFLAKGQMMA